MAVILTTKNNITFTVVLTNNTKNDLKVMYELADNVVADKWYKAMKHLRKIIQFSSNPLDIRD